MPSHAHSHTDVVREQLIPVTIIINSTHTLGETATDGAVAVRLVTRQNHSGKDGVTLGVVPFLPHLLGFLPWPAPLRRRLGLKQI